MYQKYICWNYIFLDKQNIKSMEMFITHTYIFNFLYYFNPHNLKYTIILNTKCFKKYIGISNSKYAKAKLKELK